MATDAAPDDSTFTVAPAAQSAAALLGGLLKNAPAWAVSLLVHVIVLLSMALIVSQLRRDRNGVPPPPPPSALT